MSLNMVCLGGNLCFDPELRFTKDQKPVTNLRLAVNERWTSKDGEKKEKTEFFDVVFWAGAAETLTKYARKGSYLEVVGKLSSRTYTDKDQVERKITEISGDKFSFVGSRPDSVEQVSAAIAATPAASIQEDDIPF